MNLDRTPYEMASAASEEVRALNDRLRGAHQAAGSLHEMLRQAQNLGATLGYREEEAGG